MSFPFSVSRRENFPHIEKVKIIKKSASEPIEMFQRFVVGKAKELSDININIPNNIIGDIASNSTYFQKMNMYILFLSFQIYYNSSYTSSNEYASFHKFLFDKYTNMTDTKLTFEINTYIEKIRIVLSKVGDFYLII